MGCCGALRMLMDAGANLQRADREGRFGSRWAGGWKMLSLGHVDRGTILELHVFHVALHPRAELFFGVSENQRLNAVHGCERPFGGCVSGARMHSLRESPVTPPRN